VRQPQIVLIEPLATMSAVEEFLWPRVYRSDDGRSNGEQAERSNVSLQMGSRCRDNSQSCRLLGALMPVEVLAVRSVV